MNQNLLKRPAFTLIEMLITVSIIALLAALIFPVFARVRENARKVTCQNNLRQLGIGFQQYAQDYRKYPFAGQYQKWADGGHWVTGGDGGTAKDYSDKGLAESGSTSGFTYVDPKSAYVEKGALYAYVKNADLYMCPSPKDKDKKKLSYSMNCALAGINQLKIRNPAQIVLLADEGDTLNDGYFWAVDNALSTDSLFKGHNGGGNILFADGHVKFYLFDELPLDWNTPGLTAKATTTGDVRFHDIGFGPTGSNYAAALDDATLPNKNDTCGVAIPTPGPTPAPSPSPTP